MLANLLRKLHDSVHSLSEHEADVDVADNWTNCARCGNSIGSLVDSIHVEVDDNILFLCSDTCYQRFMKSRLNQQIRLASKMVEKMKQQETARTLVTT